MMCSADFRETRAGRCKFSMFLPERQSRVLCPPAIPVGHRERIQGWTSVYFRAVVNESYVDVVGG
jgi:hypothetical protein